MNTPETPIQSSDSSRSRSNQNQEWDLPTRPPKRSDPEAAKLKGPVVELDALLPDKLISLVHDAIVYLIDFGGIFGKIGK